MKARTRGWNWTSHLMKSWRFAACWGLNLIKLPWSCWFLRLGFTTTLLPQTSRLPTCAGDAYFQRSQAQCNTNSPPVGTSEGGQEIWRGALRWIRWIGWRGWKWWRALMCFPVWPWKVTLNNGLWVKPLRGPKDVKHLPCEMGDEFDSQPIAFRVNFREFWSLMKPLLQLWIRVLVNTCFDWTVAA